MDLGGKLDCCVGGGGMARAMLRSDSWDQYRVLGLKPQVQDLFQDLIRFSHPRPVSGGALIQGVAGKQEVHETNLPHQKLTYLFLLMPGAGRRRHRGDIRALRGID